MNSRSCVCLLITSALAVGLAYAASIPVWLDDAIMEYNQRNSELPITFVAIKDSFVWYTIPQATETAIGEIRSRIYAIVERNGYEKVSDEELITTGRPPIPNKPSKQIKCWVRSFFVGGTSGAKKGRMLSVKICQGAENWYTGFRVAQ